MLNAKNRSKNGKKQEQSIVVYIKDNVENYLHEVTKYS